jgi:hypothetical protein
VIMQYGPGISTTIYLTYGNCDEVARTFPDRHLCCKISITNMQRFWRCAGECCAKVSFPASVLGFVINFTDATKPRIVHAPFLDSCLHHSSQQVCL